MNNRFLPLRLLDEKQIHKIHETSVKILEDIGINVESKVAREIFGENSCKIVGSRVYIPEHIIQDLAFIPQGKTTLYSRTGKTVDVEKGNILVHNVGAVANIIDLENGSQRAATLDDAANLVRLMDALENIHAITPIVYPQEIEQDVALLYAVREIIKNTTKPICGPGVSSIIEAQYIHEMFVALAGDEQTLREKPMYDIGFSPLSPLTFPKGDTDTAIWGVKRGIPIGALPCPIAGMTAPITFLGSLTQQNAEILAVLVLVRLIDPSVPITYSARLSYADMRYGNTVGGSPEAAITGACAVQLADFYGLDSNVYGAGSSAILGDAQMGFEKALNTIFPAIVGSNWLSGAGLVADGASISYEQLVLDNEFFGGIFQLLGSIKDDEEDYGYEVIKDIMDNNNDFVTHENTMKYLRSKEVWSRINYIGNSRVYTAWVQDGKRSIIDNAKEKADYIIKMHQVEPLDLAVEKELDKIISAARKDLIKA